MVFRMSATLSLPLVFSMLVGRGALAAAASSDVICRMERETGSNMMVQKCQTRAEFEAENGATTIAVRSGTPTPGWVWASGGATLAAGVVTGVFAATALTARKDAEQVAKSAGYDANRRISEQRDTFESRRAVAYVMGGVTAALAVTTVVGLVTRKSPVAVVPSPGGATVAVDVLSLGQALEWVAR